MRANPKEETAPAAESPQKNKRGYYNSTIKSLMDIWNVLAAHASAEHPLTTGEIFNILNAAAKKSKREKKSKDDMLSNETMLSRNTLTKHFPSDADVINTLFPNTVLCEEGKPAILHTYGHDGKLHVVMENARTDEFKEYEMQAVFLENPVASIPQPTLNRKLPQLMGQYEDTAFFNALPVSLAGVIAVRKGLSQKYIPASQWAPEDKKADPPKESKEQNSPGKTISPPRRYYLASILSPAEWRMLSDLILVYPYISEAQTRKFLSAMRRLAPGVRNWSGARYARKTHSSVQFKHIELLDEAIRSKKKVSIQYGRYELTLKSGRWQPELLRQEGPLLTASPYAMMWSNGYYYLICKLEDGTMRNLRVDRILNIGFLKDSGKDCSFQVDPDFDPYEYRDRSPVMYPGKPEVTRLRCRTTLLSTLMDFFGTTITSYTAPTPDGYTTVSLRASESGTRLFALQYADRVEVLEPQSLREEVQRTLQAAVKRYEESPTT